MPPWNIDSFMTWIEDLKFTKHLRKKLDICETYGKNSWPFQYKLSATMMSPSYAFTKLKHFEELSAMETWIEKML